MDRTRLNPKRGQNLLTSQSKKKKISRSAHRGSKKKRHLRCRLVAKKKLAKLVVPPSCVRCAASICQSIGITLMAKR